MGGLVPRKSTLGHVAYVRVTSLVRLHIHTVAGIRLSQTMTLHHFHLSDVCISRE